jgi:V/A-type H+-transporting ATPase subunit I
MIVPMKKLTLMCLENDRDRALAELRTIGVVHLGAIPAPSGHDAEQTVSRLAGAGLACRVLESLPESKQDGPAPACAAADQAMEKVLSIHAAIQRAKETLAALTAETRAAEPFGDVDAASLDALARAGVHIQFGRNSGRDFPVPEGVLVFQFHRDRSGVCLAMVSTSPFDNPYPPLAPPPRGVSAIAAERAAVEKELAAKEAELARYRSWAGEIRKLSAVLSAQRDFIAVRDSMGTAHTISWLQGFCPVPELQRVRSAADGQGWGLLVDDPAATDPVPTLIRNPAWVRPIEPLFKAIKIVPGYREPDVSLPFLLFFSIFFAMIVGDGGYGLIFLLLTIAARLLIRGAPAHPFVLMAIFSVCTIVWGIITGTYFGIAEVGGILEKGRIEWLTTTENVMNLCLIIGGIHLSLAHTWSAVRMINSTRAIAQLGWIGLIWTVFFAARALFGWSAFPSWYIPVAVGSVAAVVLFMTPPAKFREEWINHAMLPLSLMSAFADMLSYLRLFALGVASLELAKAFNTMGMNVGFGDIFRGFGAAIILFLGHTMNIALSAMSVLVHALRLNALEFSMHLGLEWSGIEYKPFREEQLTK